VESCSDCKHLDKDKTKDDRTCCKAFPNGIPLEILFGEVSHIKKYSGQKNEIIFEKITQNVKQ